MPKAMPKRRRASESTSTEVVTAARNSVGSATSADDAPVKAHSVAGSTPDEMSADFVRSCDELEAAAKPKDARVSASPRSDRVWDEQAGAPTVTWLERRRWPRHRQKRWASASR